MAAISMFAVMMGMMAVAPALATPKGNSGTDTIVCHHFATYEMDEGGNLVLDEVGLTNLLKILCLDSLCNSLC